MGTTCRKSRRQKCWYNSLGAFILDAGDGDGDENSSLMSSFSVLCVCLIKDEMDATTTAEACVFSARDNDWIWWTVSSDVYTDVSLSVMDNDQRFVGRAGGSIFFTVNHGHVLLVLDEATGDFLTITLPLAPDDVYNLYVDRKSLSKELFDILLAPAKLLASVCNMNLLPRNGYLRLFCHMLECEPP